MTPASTDTGCSRSDSITKCNLPHYQIPTFTRTIGIVAWRSKMIKKLLAKLFPCRHKVYSSIDCFRYEINTDVGYSTVLVYRCDKCGNLSYSDRWALMLGSGSQEDYSIGSQCEMKPHYQCFCDNKEWLTAYKNFLGGYFKIIETEHCLQIYGGRVA